MIERSVYNRRKRKLFLHLKNIRRIMVDRFHDIERIFIVDSMPQEICKNARANSSILNFVTNLKSEIIMRNHLMVLKPKS